MTDKELLELDERGRNIINDLLKIIPSWREVDLTKAGYDAQYVRTLLDVAIYVVEREKKVIEEFQK